MATDYEKIVEEWKEVVKNDKKATELTNELYNRKLNYRPTYEVASKLSVRLGEDLAQVLMKYAPEEGNVWDIDIMNELPRWLGLEHREIVKACEQVQNAMNKEAGLGVKYQAPKFNADRAFGMVKELQEHENFADIADSFYDQFVNFSQNIVDDSIRDNADLLWRSGIPAQVIRQAEPKCCKWCTALAGVYNYVDVKNTGNDVWRRHENCRCTIDFVAVRNGELVHDSK